MSAEAREGGSLRLHGSSALGDSPRNKGSGKLTGCLEDRDNGCLVQYATASSVLPKASTDRSVGLNCVKSCQSVLSKRQSGRRVRCSPSADDKIIGKWSLPCKSGETFHLKYKRTLVEHRDTSIAVKADNESVISPESKTSNSSYYIREASNPPWGLVV